ncbi:BMP family ABC transporter substrate-binding protein [Paenibacillus xylanexedens]|uniref:BMP family ABC transporter substrate-binding protein n=1 Tax=Paenibacillus xylanexedens TaxID=528191 RepID=UPI0009381CCD|nr:BMP family ABC transporter substrate-binding protein [Paenibacillus xylanexedens]APO44399.1 BMP family ABC transporter substrate-binding protein [Paenibacillus xylanexedens]
MKKAFFYVLLTMVLILSGCVNGKTNNANNSGPSDSDKLKVVLLIPGTLGDKSFFDAANKGLQKVKEELGAETKVIEMGADNTKWEPTFNQVVSQGWDIIISGGSQGTELLNATAEKHPDKKFINYDTDITDTADNVYSVGYAVNEASFLAGATAALVSISDMPNANPDKKIGFLGGMDIPGINTFLVGYIEGAKYAVPDIKVVVSYAGVFTDPGKGKELSLLQYNSGVDVIFTAAGGTGLGVFDAAKEKQGYAIGVDSDQGSMIAETDKDKANLILTSSVKKIDEVILSAVKEIQDGTAKMGSHKVVGIDNNGVDIIENDIYNRVVSADIRTKVNEIRGKLASGEIKVSDAMGMETSEIEKIRQSVKP